MKLVTYDYAGRTVPGLVEGKSVFDLSTIALDMIDLIAAGPGAGEQALQLARTTTPSLPLAKVRLRPPIARPRRNIMCLGKNYADHARESHAARGEKVELPTFPVVFTKATTTINGPFDDILIESAVSAKMDYEVELAVIIGRTGKNIPVSEAMDFVFGYMVFNDITARDLQRDHKQFFKGKSLDGCGPCGPWIVTADEVSNPHNLRLTCHVNGELRQDGETSQMIFNIPETIASLSRGMTLLPGDIIATGTPAGVGFAMNPPVFLNHGDVVESAIEGLGRIRNQVVAMPAS